MAKRTVLEIVQEILNDVDGDFVNSINDTEEAQQIGNLVASTYQAMMSNRNWPHTSRTLTLVPSGDSELPTHMSIGENLKELISVFYDKRKQGDTALNYDEVKWKDQDEFLRLTYARNSDAGNVEVITDTSGVKFLVFNDKAPDYFTSFDDTNLIFDSYDSGVDSTLQANKTLARGYIIPDFTLDDDFIPDLPDEAFTALIEEAKSKASFRFRQVADTKAEQEATRQNRWLSRKAWRAAGGVKYPNYGRKGARRRDPTFNKS